jgi:hypothetical protein
VRERVDARKPAGQEALHLVLGRRDEVRAARFDRIEVQVEAGRGDEKRRVDFEKPAAREERSCPFERFGTDAQVRSDAFVHEARLFGAACSGRVPFEECERDRARGGCAHREDHQIADFGVDAPPDAHMGERVGESHGVGLDGHDAPREVESSALRPLEVAREKGLVARVGRVVHGRRERVQ